MKSSGLVPNREASISKVFGSETVHKATETCMNILGVYGSISSSDGRAIMEGRVQECWFASFSDTIAAGTSEIQRNIISSRGLGLPRG